MRDLAAIHGERIKGTRQSPIRCDRCGRTMVRVTPRNDGLIICFDCRSDTYFIETVLRKRVRT